MIRPRLETRWVRALALTNTDDASIIGEVARHALPTPTADELAEVRREWTPPQDFQPSSRSHTPSFMFACRAQIEPFIRNDRREADAALELLRHHRVRELLESALLLGVPSKVIAKMLMHLLGITTTIEAVQLFSSFFFDISPFSQIEVRTLVEERVQVQLKTVLPMASLKALRRAAATDARMMALGLPRSPLSLHGVLLALGHMPPDRDLYTSIAELEKVAVARAAQVLLRAGRDDDRRADAYVNVLSKLRAISAPLANPNNSLIEAIEQLRIVRSPERMPTVAELRARGEEVGELEMGTREVEEVEVEH